MNDNLYILRSFCKDNKSIIKFGFSNTIKNRIEQYKAHNPTIEIVGTYYHKDGILFERKVHSCIKSEIGREWYSEDKLEELLRYVNEGFPPKIYKHESLLRLDIALLKYKFFVLQKDKRKVHFKGIRLYKKIIKFLEQMVIIHNKFSN